MGQGFPVYILTKNLCELYLADFPFKRFSFIASPSVLWFCGGAVVKRFELILPSSRMIVDQEELLISISGVECFASSGSLLVDFCVDIFPLFLNVEGNSRLAVSNIL